MEDVQERIKSVAEAIAKAHEGSAEAPTPVVAEEEVNEEIVAAPVESEDDHEEEDTEESAGSDGEDATAHPKKNKGVGKRINELTKDKHEALRAAEAERAEKEYWRQLALKAQQPQAEAPAQQATDKPTREQFGYDEEAYQEARDKWVVEQAKKSWIEEAQAAETNRKMQEKASSFSKQIAEIEQENPGAWRQALSAPITFSETMLEVLQDSPVGARVGVYLAENLDEALAITQLPPYRQAAALGQIEERIKTSQKAKSAPPTSIAQPQKAVTRAPAPPPVVQSAAPVKVPLEQWGVAGHIAALRAKQSR